MRGWLALLPILLGALSGCVWTGDVERSAWRKRFDQQPISPDLVQIQVALIERPIGEEYIHQQLWDSADEMICRRGALEDNGFRIGQLVGTPPDGLQKMLLSSQCCTPQGMVFPPDRAMPIELGPLRPRTVYHVVLPKTAESVTLDQAGFMFDVVASFTSTGATKLTFTPKVENSEAALPFRARPDQSTWELRKGRPSRQYPDISWNVTLATNQYLLIGARYDRPGTLGWTTFMQPEANVQRLLVIRNIRNANTDGGGAALEDRIRSEKATPLALQAQSVKR